MQLRDLKSKSPEINVLGVFRHYRLARIELSEWRSLNRGMSNKSTRFALKTAEQRRTTLMRRLESLPPNAKCARPYKTIFRLMGPAFIAARAQDRGGVLDSAEFMLSLLEAMVI